MKPTPDMMQQVMGNEALMSGFDDPEGDDPPAAPPSGKRARATSPSDESDGGNWSGDSDSD